MCGNNPNVAPQVNNAKCIGGTALGFAIVTIVGFLLDWPGAISAVAGILSVIGNSIVCCCGPKAKGEGAGKFTAAMVLNIIACILHFAAIIGVVVFYLGMLAHVNAETAKCVECACRTEYQNSAPSTYACGESPSWTTIIFALIAGILEAVGAAKCSAAKAAILADGPSTASV